MAASSSDHIINRGKLQIMKRTNDTAADIRVRSYGAARKFGFQPLTAKGEAWIRAICTPLGGQWVDKPGDRCFWIEDWQILKDTLRDSDLIVVTGVGPTSAHDHPADAWLGRRTTAGE